MRWNAFFDSRRLRLTKFAVQISPNATSNFRHRKRPLIGASSTRCQNSTDASRMIWPSRISSCQRKPFCAFGKDTPGPKYTSGEKADEPEEGTRQTHRPVAPWHGHRLAPRRRRTKLHPPTPAFRLPTNRLSLDSPNRPFATKGRPSRMRGGRGSVGGPGGVQDGAGGLPPAGGGRHSPRGPGRPAPRLPARPGLPRPAPARPALSAHTRFGSRAASRRRAASQRGREATAGDSD